MEYTEEEKDIILHYGTPSVFDELLNGVIQGSHGLSLSSTSSQCDHRHEVLANERTTAFLTETHILDNAGLHDDLPQLLDDTDPISLVVLRNTNTTRATDSIFLSEALLGVTSITAAAAEVDYDLETEVMSILKLADDELQRKDYHYNILGSEGSVAEAYVLGIDDDATDVAGRCRSPPLTDREQDGEHTITMEELDDISNLADARIRHQDSLRAAHEGTCSGVSVPLYEGEPTEDIQERVQLAQQHSEALCHREMYSGIIAQNIKATIRDNSEMVVKELVALDSVCYQGRDEQSTHSSPSSHMSHIKSITDRIFLPASKRYRGVPVQYYDPCYMDKLSKAAMNDENEFEIIKNDNMMTLSHSSLTANQQVVETSSVEKLIPMSRLENTYTHEEVCAFPRTHYISDTELPNGAILLTSNRKGHTKKDSREKWLLLQEAKETSSMRREDDAALRMHRIFEANSLSAARERQNLDATECSSRLIIVGDESTEIEDMIRRKDRQKGVIMQYLMFNFENDKKRASGDTIDKETKIRENIVDMEEYEIAEKINMFNLQSKDITRRDHQRESIVHEGIVSSRVNIIQDEEYEREQLIREKCRGESYVVLLMTERVAEEKKAAVAQKNEEDIKRRKELSHFADVPSFYSRLQKFNEIEIKAVADELFRATSGIKTHRTCSHIMTMESAADQSLANSLIASINDMPTPQGSPSSKGDVVLNADLFYILHPKHFALSDGSPTAATVVFRSVSCALESLTEVDYVSLSKMSVNVHKLNDIDDENETGRISRQSSNAAVAKLRGMRKRQLPISPIVEQLDLSNNMLSFLPKDALLTTFPSLRKLNIANNKILDFLSVHESSNTLRTYQKIVDLDLSMNGATAAIDLSAFPSLMRLVAYANRFEELNIRFPLNVEDSSNLQVIELSRNMLKSLASFAHCPKLSSLDVSRNKIEDLTPVLTSCVFLQRLYVSHNNIVDLSNNLGIGSSITATWKCIFLRHLFISDNRLVHLGPLAHCPFLTILHAESNRIECIEGLRGCPLLEIIDLSFNALCTWESLLPLSHCKEATSVAINDNPVESPTDINDDLYIDPKNLLIALCPKLKELNSDIIQETERYSANLWYTSESAVIIHDAIQKRRFFCFPEQQVELLIKLEKEYRAVCRYYNRRHQMALMAEKELTRSLKETKSFKLTSLLRDSVTAWTDSQLGVTFLLVHHLNILKKFVNENGVHCVCNVDGARLEDMLSLRMSQNKLLQQQITVCAASIVRDAVRGWVLVRRAKAELLRLKASTGRYSDAATKIQSVWRGAIVRYRLKKVLFDDDFILEKVEWSDPYTRDNKISNVLKGVLDIHGLPKVLEVSKTRCTSGFQAPIGFFKGEVDLSGSDIVRHNTAQLEEKQRDFRPSSQPIMSSMDNTNNDITERGVSSKQLTDDWSSAIQAHIKMKNMKSSKQRQESIRKEFISDPLRAKQKFGK